VDYAALRARQLEVALVASMEGSLSGVRRFVALDISNLPRSEGGRAPLYAAAVILERGNPRPLETATAALAPTLPYVPGFLSFREAPAAVAALEKLSLDFDLLYVDGHGLTHPRRAGIATHLGVLLEKPSLGVAKNLLAGTVGELGPEVGATAPITLGGEMRGYALRTRARGNPVYVSSGHRCTPEAALSFVLEHLDGRRLPFPTRAAHEAANAARRAGELAAREALEPVS